MVTSKVTFKIVLTSDPKLPYKVSLMLRFVITEVIGSKGVEYFQQISSKLQNVFGVLDDEIKCTRTNTFHSSFEVCSRRGNVFLKHGSELRLIPRDRTEANGMIFKTFRNLILLLMRLSLTSKEQSNLLLVGPPPLRDENVHSSKLSTDASSPVGRLRRNVSEWIKIGVHDQFKHITKHRGCDFQFRLRFG
ncbi:hypothetical protein KUTeg_024510 [Tegillarca granosa]|uniref:Uncharacterized protein n=1 Tax=Tegillarca granosa TaxID=220873 RepID=A0ABQ9DXH5_TEGGR|nr:hypothetical protein KUTeg_024510 [Tegillarca granosa]